MVEGGGSWDYDYYYRDDIGTLVRFLGSSNRSREGGGGG